MDFSTPVSSLPKVGPFLLKKLKRLQIDTVGDLIYHIPFRYENIGATRKISQVGVGDTVSIAGSILSIRNIRTRFGKILTKATINDGSNSIEAVWFNQPFLAKTFKTGSSFSFAGKIDLFSHHPTLINPVYEELKRLNNKLVHTKGFVPIYPETAGLSSKWFRNKINSLLPILLSKMEDPLPEEVRKRNSLISLRDALLNIHSPESLKSADLARKRLAFDELLITQIKTLERKKSWERKKDGVEIGVAQEKILELISGLPFTLTKSQNKVLKDILADLNRKQPMNRLLQGDVGTGKTIVAAIAAYAVFLSQYQIAFMAPTELLAFQHYKTINSILRSLGVKIALKTSSRKLSKENEDFDIIVGTHALLSSDLIFNKLAFIVIDEQHRFGVKQRALLRKKGPTPHVLTMSATPIPRSLALTLYGDLDISLIEEPLPDRKPVKTRVVPPDKRNQAYAFIERQIKKGRQAFIIFPLIEPSESLETVKAATNEYERLKNEIFPDLSIGLLHGRINSKDKESVINHFVEKKYDILVATPVVEVGIDIPNTSIMMIEAAERFGLASLHQLRGRVGRGSVQSFCLLFTESSSFQVLERLEALEKYNAGLKLAEIDLKMRGPGQIYGTAQSGLPEFKIASLTDTALLEQTKKESKPILKQMESGKLPNFEKLLSESSFVTPD